MKTLPAGTWKLEGPYLLKSYIYLPFESFIAVVLN